MKEAQKSLGRGDYPRTTPHLDGMSTVYAGACFPHCSSSAASAKTLQEVAKKAELEAFFKEFSQEDIDRMAAAKKQRLVP